MALRGAIDANKAHRPIVHQCNKEDTGQWTEISAQNCNAGSFNDQIPMFYASSTMTQEGELTFVWVEYLLLLTLQSKLVNQPRKNILKKILTKKIGVLQDTARAPQPPTNQLTNRTPNEAAGPICVKESIFWGRNVRFWAKNPKFYGMKQRFWYLHNTKPPRQLVCIDFLSSMGSNRP